MRRFPITACKISYVPRTTVPYWLWLPVTYLIYYFTGSQINFVDAIVFYHFEFNQCGSWWRDSLCLTINGLGVFNWILIIHRLCIWFNFHDISRKILYFNLNINFYVTENIYCFSVRHASSKIKPQFVNGFDTPRRPQSLNTMLKICHFCKIMIP